MSIPEHTGPLDAAYLELTHRHGDLIRQLSRLAAETQHQVDRLSAGETFQVFKLSNRVQAVNEARKLHVAAGEAVDRLTKQRVNQ